MTHNLIIFGLIALALAPLALFVFVHSRPREVDEIADSHDVPISRMTPDPIVNGQQAQRAMEQFLAPAFDAVASAYTTRLSGLAAAEPWASDKIVKLALANRVLTEVRGQIEALIADGHVAAHDKARADKIAAIPIERRKLMGML